MHSKRVWDIAAVSCQRIKNAKRGAGCINRTGIEAVSSKHKHLPEWSSYRYETHTCKHPLTNLLIGARFLNTRGMGLAWVFQWRQHCKTNLLWGSRLNNCISEYIENLILPYLDFRKLHGREAIDQTVQRAGSEILLRRFIWGYWHAGARMKALPSTSIKARTSKETQTHAEKESLNRAKQIREKRGKKTNLHRHIPSILHAIQLAWNPSSFTTHRCDTLVQ